MKRATIFTILLAGLSFFALSGCDDGNGTDQTDADAAEDRVELDATAEGEGDGIAEVPPDQVGDPPVEDALEEDAVEEDAAGDETPTDTIEEETTQTGSVTGQIWAYKLMEGGQYTTEPKGGVSVTAVGEGLEPSAFTVTTSALQCDRWWERESFECGKFSIDDIPAGTDLMLKVHDPAGDSRDTIGKIVNVDDGEYQVLVLIGETLVDAAFAAWGITEQTGKGLIVGLLARNLDPTESEPISGFIGGATVEIDPEPDCPSCNIIVYYDSDDFSNTERTSTDPDQSLFFMLNEPPEAMSDPYSLDVTSDTHTFDTAEFAVEANSVTYLLMVGEEI